jgi:hypothetical protein
MLQKYKCLSRLWKGAALLLLIPFLARRTVNNGVRA